MLAVVEKLPTLQLVVVLHMHDKCAERFGGFPDNGSKMHGVLVCHAPLCAAASAPEPPRLIRQVGSTDGACWKKRCSSSAGSCHGNLRSGTPRTSQASSASCSSPLSFDSSTRARDSFAGTPCSERR